ncbi:MULTISPECIES: glycerophosphodiester phosphodiesterase family protein [Arenibacter]|uniref:glycerophosphodiester phosphodiesterase family protein n=1 Tax=Arenibacter TaxID=178469 RepID=UPI000A39FD2E|nr:MULTISPECIES: glycerophosphodiester phosphodiesterase family protein [Arenibacter]
MNNHLSPHPKKLLLVLLLFLYVGLAAQESNLDRILIDFKNNPEQILVAAHRATNDYYPENSLAAIKESIRIGVDIVELDIRQSKDGVLLIMHDRTLDRTTNGSGNVSDFSLDQLKDLRLLFKDSITTERIPTFKEVLQLTKGKVLLDIDFKLEDMAAVEKAYSLIQEFGMENQILFFLYDYKETPRLQEMDSEIRIMPRAYSRREVRAIQKMDLIDIIHIDESFYKDRKMRKIIDSGTRVWINALGKYDSMERLEKDAGFDALLSKKYVNVIQTDLPEALLNYLRARKLHR